MLRIILSSFYLPLAAFCLAPPAAALDLDRSERGVVRVIAEGQSGAATGTGFAVQGRRVIATNFHVVKDRQVFHVGYLEGGQPRIVRAQLIASLPQRDLALLRTETDVVRTALPVARYKPAKTTAVFAIGFPGNADVISGGADGRLLNDPSFFEPTVTTGTVSRVVFDNLVTKGLVVQHGATINQGNSGGPLIDECGRVVGVNTFLPREGQGIFFSIHSSELLTFFLQHNVSASIADSPCQPGAQITPEEAQRAAEADERQAFQSFEGCIAQNACQFTTCLNDYNASGDPALRAPRRPQIEQSERAATAACARKTAERALEDLKACARATPCRFHELCEAAYLRATLSGAGVSDEAAFTEAKTAAGGACAREQAERPGAGMMVSAGDYYADLSFESSPHRDAEMLMGNCINQRVKVSVTRDYAVSWEIKEGGRRTRWRGSVNPATAEVFVPASQVEMIMGPGGGAPRLTAGAQGKFTKVKVEFSPCGSAILTVRNRVQQAQ